MRFVCLITVPCIWEAAGIRAGSNKNQLIIVLIALEALQGWNLPSIWGPIIPEVLSSS
jgi:hypothetical protein